MQLFPNAGDFSWLKCESLRVNATYTRNITMLFPKVVIIILLEEDWIIE